MEAFIALFSGRDYYSIVMNRFLCFRLLVALAALGMLVGSSCEPLQQETKPAQEEPGTMPVERAITIVVVYDNYKVNSNLSPSWGFGCVIRTPTQDILFDTGGDSSILLSNMEKMNIDPKDIDIVVISHIHGDHVGGLDGFLDRNANVRVYIPASFPDSWRDKIESHGAEYRDVPGATQISDRVYTTGEMGTWIKEQSLVVDTNEGLVIISGCAHPGVLNIAKKARQILPHREFYLFMGGFHLSGSSDSELRNIVQGFRDIGVRKVAPSHCSGDRCRELFSEEYQEDYIKSGVGKKIVLLTSFP